LAKTGSIVLPQIPEGHQYSLSCTITPLGGGFFAGTISPDRDVDAFLTLQNRCPRETQKTARGTTDEGFVVLLTNNLTDE
jgi:hypothetical protein